ncbi:hypothetical protein MNBD_BACTEROID07-1468, partial [hydrothermal vent metagenome]
MTVSEEKIYFLFLFLLIFTIATPAMAQSDSTIISQDSTRMKPDTTSVYYFTGSLDSLKAGVLTYVDTSLTYFHQYDPVEKRNRMFNTLSNIGLASYNRVFTPSVSVGYVTKSRVFAPYMHYNNQVKYYKLKRPYTQLQYFMGPKKEQSLGVTFSRKMSKLFTFGVDLYLVNSPGRYTNSKSDNKYVYFTSRYHTQNNRYAIVSNYLHNKVIVRENGGITMDSLFRMNLEKDRRAIPVGLTTGRNMVKSSGFYVGQTFNLQKPGMRNDSTPRKLAGGSVSYSFLYQRNQMVYTDDARTDTTFYMAFPTSYNDSITYDSAYQQIIRNRFMWSSLAYNKDRLSQVFRAYFGVQYDHILQTYPYDSARYINNQLISFGGIALRLFRRSFLHGSAEMVFGGYNSGDLKIDGSLLQYLGSVEKNIGQLYFRVMFANRKPAWYFSEYSSNRFNWKLNLQKERIFSFTGEYRYKFIRTGATFQSLGNYTYFNDSVFPQQAANPGSVLQIYADGTIPLHYFGINLRAVYQTTTMAYFLHLPVLTGKMNVFFKKWIFKGAAHLQTGVQVSYFTSYFADAYMPELRAFYTQHNKKIGDYLYLDLYASMKIKSFRFFLQGKNLLGFLGNYYYYNSPEYPGADG